MSDEKHSSQDQSGQRQGVPKQGGQGTQQTQHEDRKGQHGSVGGGSQQPGQTGGDRDKTKQPGDKQEQRS
jgi:hypothetical protein